MNDAREPSVVSEVVTTWLVMLAVDCTHISPPATGSGPPLTPASAILPTNTGPWKPAFFSPPSVDLYPGSPAESDMYVPYPLAGFRRLVPRMRPGPRR